MAEPSGRARTRHDLVAAAQQLELSGLNVNASGNLSVRVPGGLIVTPSGVPPHALVPGDGVALSPTGIPANPRGRVPTSEWRLHVEILRRRPDIGAIVHTHSPEATAAAILDAAVPAVHYLVARFGGSTLPCAPYATYGSPELATNVADTLGDRGMACLMANHGAIALGHDLGAAIALALDVEWFCGVHRRARQLGSPIVLADDEIARVAELFEGYGQPWKG